MKKFILSRKPLNPVRSFIASLRINSSLLIILLVFFIGSLAIVPRMPTVLADSQNAGICTRVVPDRSSVEGNTVLLPNGTSRTYPSQYCPDLNSRTNATVPTINDWIESTTMGYGGGFSSISSTWTVPQVPQNTNDPLIFLFDSFQGYNGRPYIIQPVLAFGKDYYSCWPFTCYIGGSYWWMASWFVYTDNNQYTISSILNVNVGDQIKGTIAWITSGCNGNGSGGSGYLITAQDSTLLQSRSLYTCFASKATTANSAVLEAYRINYCTQLPNQSSIWFSSIGSNPSLGWGTNVNQGLAPSCNYDIDAPVNVYVNSYPTTDTYLRSHGMSVDSSLPNPWWPPYQSGYEFKVTSSAFGYNVTKYLSAYNSNHYLQEAASGFLPGNAWHSKIYINNVLKADADVARDHPATANFAVVTADTAILMI